MAKMRRIRKPLAWALSVMLIFTALPLTAFADEAIPADSMPTTEDVLGPMLDDTPLPTPEPTPEITIEPTPEPTPEATPEPMPEATTEPTPEPSSAPETTSEPTEAPMATPEPTASPSAAPTPAPTPTPVPVEDPYVPGFTVIESEIGGAHAWPVPEHFDVTQGYNDQHAALDIAADTGTPVVAADDGTITVTQTWNGIVTKGDSNSYGNMVQVTHADGTVTLYAHLSEINVRQGDTVVRGQQIGRVGSTGNSSGPHLHFEVRSNGSKVDPMAYITEDSTDAEKRFEELLEQYGGYIGEDGKLYTTDDRSAIDKPLNEIAAEAGLDLPTFYAGNITVSEPTSGYTINIGYTSNNGQQLGWGQKRVNGKVAYCVEDGVAIGLGDNTGYSERELTKNQRVRLSLIDYWGRNKNVANIQGSSNAVNHDWQTTTVSGQYIAEFYTQLLIWETIADFGGDFIGATSISIPSDVGGMGCIASQSTYNAFKKAVLAKVDQFYTTPSISGQIVTMKVGETVTLTDITGALASYKDTPVVNTTGISVTKTGNKVTLTATGNPNPSGVVSFGYSVDLNYLLQSPGYYYKHAVEQDVVTCGFSGGDPTSISFRVNIEMNGSLKIVKTSEDGVVSGVRFNVTGNGVNTTVQTGPDGTITIPNLQDGTVLTVTELTSDQYVQPQSQTVTIKANETATVSFTNVLKKWTATITKRDSSTGTAQGDASLAGAVYGVYRGNDLIDQYTTNSDGQFTTKEYICGDNWSIREISPSNGYLIDSTVYPVGAEPKNYSLEHNKIEITVKEQVIKGKVQIHKQYEILNGSPADESGAEFQVYLKSAGSYAAAKEAERDTITTNASGYATTKDMPCGTYIVHQSKGGAGRETVDDFEVVVAENGKTYSYELLNELKNGQLKIVKTSDTGKVEGISFRVTRLKDNYSKVYKTDASGLIFTETLPIFEDNAGTTKYQYLVEELDTEETFGYELPDPQIVTLQDGGVAEVKFHNVPLEIGTTAKFENGTKDTQSADDVVLVDTVSYSGLQIGKEYTVSGTLMDKATGKPFLDFDGHEVKAETTFTPESRDGTVDVIFKFNSLNIKLDTDVVVFETLYREGMELTTHADIDDEGQTVKIRMPEIGTTAEFEDGSKEIIANKEIVVIDTVSYKDLKPEREYTVSGILMDKATGSPFLDADGNIVVGETVFTPEEPTGTVEVEFRFNANFVQEDTEIVVFEDLYYGDVQLAAHADLEDESQTVTVHPLHGFVEILKLNNMDNSPLAGTKFGIFRAETDELVEEIVTSESGMAKSGPLLFGPYYLLEIDPSHGFLPSDTRYDFFIDEDGEIISFEITNTAKIGKMDMSYHEGNTPRTGDTRPILLCILLSLLSGSAVIVLLAFRKRKSVSKLILSLALSLLTVAIMSAPIHVDAVTTDTPEISVSGDTLTMMKEIISLDRNEQIEFAETNTEDGKTYRLIDVSSSVISDTAVTEEQVLSVQREEIVADKSASIADTYTQDGVTYSLKDIQFQPHEITDYTATVTEDVLLGPAVSQPDADDSITVPYHIDEYDLTLDCTLPLSSVSSGSPYWLDDVRIPMQIYDTGALYMEFNGQVLPFDGSTPPLAGFEYLFLDYLGLSGDTYRLTSAVWDGDPYTENGTECRDAIISGSRLVSDYTAHYGGEITLPPFTVYDATATYEAVQTVETGETEYTIQAVAQYEEDHSTLTAVILGAAVGIIGIASAVAVILAILAKKRKRKETSK